jgi:hypothetical protein
VKVKGKMVDYKVAGISEHMSFLEMMDVLNEQLINRYRRDGSFVIKNSSFNIGAGLAFAFAR